MRQHQDSLKELNFNKEIALADFKPGDIVRLKSGGPNMTITGRGDQAKFFRGEILCQWFIGKKSVKESFLPDVLVLVDELENKKK